MNENVLAAIITVCLFGYLCFYTWLEHRDRK
jgi:hypothetical protein